MSARTSVRTAPRHAALTVLAVMTTVTSLGTQPARTGTPRSAVDRMQEPGAEAQELARRSGTWSVVMTIRANPDATPDVTTGMIAERKMVGTFLEEVMKPAPGSTLPDFRRIAFGSLRLMSVPQEDDVLPTFVPPFISRVTIPRSSARHSRALLRRSNDTVDFGLALFLRRTMCPGGLGFNADSRGRSAV